MGWKTSGGTSGSDPTYLEPRVTAVEIRTNNMAKVPNRQTWIASEGQTDFTIDNGTISNVKLLDVYIGGVPQDEITLVSPTVFQVSEALSAGMKVYAEWFEVEIPMGQTHMSTHEAGGIDELDVTRLKNYNETVASPIDIIKNKTESHGIIKLGINAGKNAPAEPSYTGDKFYKNIAIGGYAMQNSTGSWNNIAIGWNTLNALTKGEYYNIGIGNESLYYTNKPIGDTDSFTATRNIGIGMNALRFNVKGYQNLALGRNSLQCTVNGNQNTTVGVNAMSGIAPLDLTGAIVNLTKNDSNNATAVGYNSLKNNVSTNNTAVGCSSGENIKNAVNNVAIGRNSLYLLQTDVTTDGNTKIDWSKTGTYVWSGTVITVTITSHGLQNGYLISLGLSTGNVLSTEENHYIVSNVTTDTFTVTAPISNTTSGNVWSSWYSNNTAVTKVSDGNTSVGAYSMENSTSGTNNVAVGVWSYRSGTGDNNTAIGGLAASNLTTGQNNTAVGYNALRYMQDGTNAITVSNSTGLGFNSRTSGSNQVQLGGSGQSTYAYGAVQDRSDQRDKTDIRDTELGLEFINRLRPVDFKWDYRDDYIEIDEETGEVIRFEKDGSKKRNRYHHGLIAQEIKQVIDETGIDFGGFQDHAINGGNDVLSIGYTELISPLIKAVQELTARVQELENKI